MNGPELVRRESGILVAPGLGTEPDAEKPGKEPITYDPDGRRRLVLSKNDQRRIDRLINDMRARGLGLIVACMSRQDDKPPCCGPLMAEKKGMPDAGYGCLCTRIYFL